MIRDLLYIEVVANLKSAMPQLAPPQALQCCLLASALWYQAALRSCREEIWFGTCSTLRWWQS